MNHEDMRKIIEMRRKANDEKYEAHSKANLKRHVEKKIKTTMIGAISKFENYFGELWGHGLEEYELTDQQRKWRDRWDLTRTEILNNGNNQKRAAEAEIDNYSVKYNKKEYGFIVKKEDQE